MCIKCDDRSKDNMHEQYHAVRIKIKRLRLKEKKIFLIKIL